MKSRSSFIKVTLFLSISILFLFSFKFSVANADSKDSGVGEEIHSELRQRLNTAHRKWVTKPKRVSPKYRDKKTFYTSYFLVSDFIPQVVNFNKNKIITSEEGSIFEYLYENVFFKHANFNYYKLSSDDYKITISETNPQNNNESIGYDEFIKVISKNKMLVTITFTGLASKYNTKKASILKNYYYSHGVNYAGGDLNGLVTY